MIVRPSTKILPLEVSTRLTFDFKPARPLDCPKRLPLESDLMLLGLPKSPRRTSTSSPTRTVTVRVGDEVEVLRGDFGNPNSTKSDSKGKRLGQSRGRAGLKSKVNRVDTSSGRIFVDGLTITTADGKEEAIPIHPSNLVVTALYEGDPVRIKQLIERGGVQE